MKQRIQRTIRRLGNENRDAPDKSRTPVLGSQKEAGHGGASVAAALEAVTDDPHSGSAVLVLLQQHQPPAETRLTFRAAHEQRREHSKTLERRGSRHALILSHDRTRIRIERIRVCGRPVSAIS
jgi:hypothetical protein